MSAIEQIYGGLLAQLPADLRKPARGLPELLGLSAGPDARWEDFVRLEPNRDLPAFAAEDPAAPGQLLVPADTLAAFRRAHACAGFYGLLIDRLADGQAQPSPVLGRLEAHLLEHWQVALAAACGDAAVAAEDICEAQEAWTQGIGLEQLALARGRVTPLEYRTLVSLKLSWIGTAGRCLLRLAGQSHRIAGFRRAHELLLLSCQLVDDAVDSAEDERLHGHSYPAALGYPAGGLIRAAPRLVRRSAGLTAELGCHRLARWLTDHASRLEGLVPPGNPLQNELAGMILAGAMES